jgi:hypothetical protein
MREIIAPIASLHERYTDDDLFRPNMALLVNTTHYAGLVRISGRGRQSDMFLPIEPLTPEPFAAVPLPSGFRALLDVDFRRDHIPAQRVRRMVDPARHWVDVGTDTRPVHMLIGGPRLVLRSTQDVNQAWQILGYAGRYLEHNRPRVVYQFLAQSLDARGRVRILECDARRRLEIAPEFK